MKARLIGQKLPYLQNALHCFNHQGETMFLKLREWVADHSKAQYPKARLIKEDNAERAALKSLPLGQVFGLFAVSVVALIFGIPLLILCIVFIFS
jgi:hypothetical protein